MKHLISTLAATALAVGIVGAASPAQAATISGWGNGVVGVPQAITVTGVMDLRGLPCTDPSEPFIPTIGGVRQTIQSVSVTNGSATVSFTPLSAGTASWTLGGGGGPLTSCETVSSVPATISAVSAPSAPQAFTADAPVQTLNPIINLAWQAPASDGGSPITGYRLTDTASGAVANFAPSVTAYQVYPVNHGQTYGFTLAAVNAAGTGPAAAVSVTVPLAPPTEPTSVSALALGSDSVRLSWGAPVATGGTPITGYVVTNDIGTVLATTSASTNTYTLTGLTPGRSYSFFVAAVNAAGTGTSVMAQATTAPTAPSAPVLELAAATATQAALTWTLPADNGSPIASYVVSASDGSVYNVAPDAGNFLIVTPEGSTMTYTVEAVNAVGSSPASNAVTWTGGEVDPDCGLLGCDPNTFGPDINPTPSPSPTPTPAPTPPPSWTLEVVAHDVNGAPTCPAGWTLGGWEEWSGAQTCGITTTYNPATGRWSNGTAADLSAVIAAWEATPVEAPVVDVSDALDDRSGQVVYALRAGKWIAVQGEPRDIPRGATVSIVQPRGAKTRNANVERHAAALAATHDSGAVQTTIAKKWKGAPRIIVSW